MRPANTVKTRGSRASARKPETPCNQRSEPTDYGRPDRGALDGDARRSGRPATVLTDAAAASERRRTRRRASAAPTSFIGGSAMPTAISVSVPVLCTQGLEACRRRSGSTYAETTRNCRGTTALRRPCCSPVARDPRRRVQVRVDRTDRAPALLVAGLEICALVAFHDAVADRGVIGYIRSAGWAGRPAAAAAARTLATPWHTPPRRSRRRDSAVPLQIGPDRSRRIRTIGVDEARLCCCRCCTCRTCTCYPRAHRCSSGWRSSTS